jgi:hypothetical protein
MVVIMLKGPNYVYYKILIVISSSFHIHMQMYAML